jgi:putative acetyltransferase
VNRISGPVPVSFDSPDAVALTRAQQSELRGRDGEGDIGPAREASMFEPPDGVFLVIRDGEQAIACGGLARFDERRAELKRMYVAPEARGSGHGRRLLEELEAWARRLGYAAVRLETGEGQAEALGLYRSAGYLPIPCYGVYATRASSRCFEKDLESPGLR